MLQGIALRREDIKDPEQRTATHVIVDECHNFVTPSIETILLETGKYRMFLTLCQQNVGYGMGTETRKVVTGMTHVKMAGLIEPDHWERTARLFPMDARLLQELDRGAFFARFGMNVPTVRFQARSDLLAYDRSMTKPAWQRLMKRQLRLYYRPTEEPEYAGPNTAHRASASGRRRRHV